MATRNSTSSSQNRDPQAPIGTSPGTSRKMSPLAWIIIALVVVVAAVALVSRSGTWRTPSGGTMPMAHTDPAPAMPANPAGPNGAPATPANQTGPG